MCSVHAVHIFKMADEDADQDLLRGNGFFTKGVEDSRILFGYTMSDCSSEDESEGYSDDSSDDEAEAEPMEPPRKKGCPSTKKRSEDSKYIVRKSPKRPRHLVAVDHLHTVHCCVMLCLAQCLTAMSDTVHLREYFGQLTKHEQKQWILDYLHMNKRIHSDGTTEFFFSVGTAFVCLQAWLCILGFPLSSFYRIRRLVLDGIKHIPASIGRTGHVKREVFLAMEWLKDFAYRFGDKMPDSSKIHLPMCIAKGAVYDMMVQDLKDIGEDNFISKSHFMRVWRDKLNYIAIPKTSRFSKCDKCMLMKKHLMETMDKDLKTQIRERREKHLLKQNLQRQKYYKHMLKAKRSPERYLSMIVDGMDQNKTSIPHFTQWSKTTQSIWKLCVHLTGVIVHGIGTFGLFDYNQFKHNSNLTIAVLLHVLLSNEIASIPDTLYLQMDNCARENKNRFILGFLCLLVELGIFKKVKLSFLMVGHTHEDIDRSFSSLSKRLKTNSAKTMDDLLNEWRRAQYPAPHGACLQYVHDVSTWLEDCMQLLTGHSRPHAFKIAKGENGKAQIMWKKWATDMIWKDCGSRSGNESLLHSRPTGRPESSDGSFAGIDFKRLEDDLKKAKDFLSEDNRKWWECFLSGVKEKGSVKPSHKWALETLVRKAQKPKPVPCKKVLEFDFSDEDEPIPSVKIVKKKRKL